MSQIDWDIWTVIEVLSGVYFFGLILDLVVTWRHQNRIIASIENVWVRVEETNFRNLREALASSLHRSLSGPNGSVLSRNALVSTSVLSAMLTFTALTFGWYLRGTQSSFVATLQDNFTEADVLLSIVANLPFDVATVWVSSMCFREMSRASAAKFAGILVLDLLAASVLGIACVYTCDYLVRHVLDATTYGAEVTAFSVLTGFRDGFLAVFDPLHCDAGAIGFLTIFYSATLFLPTLIGLILLLIAAVARGLAIASRQVASILLQSAAEGRGGSFKVFRLTLMTLALMVAVPSVIWRVVWDLGSSSQFANRSGKVEELFACIDKRTDVGLGTSSVWKYLVLVDRDGVESRVFEGGDEVIRVVSASVFSSNIDRVRLRVDLVNSSRGNPESEVLSINLARFIGAPPVLGLLSSGQGCFVSKVVFDSWSAYTILLAVDSIAGDVCRASLRAISR